jgi:hypothetical protein
MYRILLVCSFLATALSSFSQSTTHIGVEVAYSADFFKINGARDVLTPPDISSALWGATIRRTFNKTVFLETGLYARAYKVGVAFLDGYGSSGTDRKGYLVPLRAGLRLPILKGAIAFCPVAGITLGVTDEGYGGKVEGTKMGVDQNRLRNIRYTYTVQYPSQVLTLFQAGMGIDIRLGRKNLLSISTNYYGGFTKIMEQHIEYEASHGAPGEISALSMATQHSKGGFYTVGIGFKHQVDWF